MRRVRNAFGAALMAAGLAFSFAEGPALPASSPPIAPLSWVENGVAVCAAEGDQTRPRGCADGAGGVFLVWQDGRAGPEHDIYAIRIGANGVPAAGWTPDGGAVCAAPGLQSEPRIVPDGAGGALIAWLDRRGATPALYALRMLGSGAVAPGWPANGLLIRDGVATDAYSPIDMDADGEGGAVIAFLEAPESSPRAHVLRITNAGLPAPGWPADGFDVSRGGYGDEDLRAASDGSGGAHIAWHYTSPWCYCHECQYCTASVGYSGAARVDATGILWQLWGGLQPIGSGGPQHFAFSSDGSRGVFWEWGRGVGGRDHPSLPLQRYDSSGIRLWETWLWLSTYPSPLMAPDGLGGVFVLSRFYAARVTANGEMAPGWRLDGNPVCTVSQTKGSPLPPVADGTGGAYFLWSEFGGAAPDLYATRMTPDGVNAPGWAVAGSPVCTAPGEQAEARMFADGLGGAVVAWRDTRHGNHDIYAQRLGVDGPVPTAISLVRADANAGLVRLVWSGALAAGDVALERRGPSSGWEAIANLIADGDGRFEYEDRAVRPGERYGYRLVVREEDGVAFVAEAWIEVPQAPRFGLSGLRPNPAAGKPIVAFTLPDGAAARLEMLDLHGRRIAFREVGDLGSGQHLLDLAPDRDVPPGVYLIRLTRAGSSLVVRGVTMR